MDYSQLMNTTMTYTQCANHELPSVIGLSIIIVFLFACMIFFAFRYTQLRDFVKETQQQAKFQKWREENKGLRI